MKSRNQARNPGFGGIYRAGTRWRGLRGSITFQPSLPDSDMADFTQEWIEHLKGQIEGRMNLVKDKMDAQAYDELVTDLAWFTFRFARDPDTKMRKVFR
ncbi:MAG: hypothetical protein ACJ8AF_08855 [Gemmatimonadaceae bacterium]|jgi:hypothetical protein